VNFTYQLEENYKIVSWSVYTTKGEKINLQKNSFLMPDSDVLIIPNIMLVKKQTHQIKIESDDGMDVSIKKCALNGEKVTFSYDLEDGFEVQNISIKDTFGNSIPFKNQIFQMPDSDVTISFKTKRIIQENSSESLKEYYVPNTKEDNKIFWFFFFFVAVLFFRLNRFRNNSIC